MQAAYHASERCTLSMQHSDVSDGVLYVNHRIISGCKLPAQEAAAVLCCPVLRCAKLQLAHPVYGVMPLEYRPVDCVTDEPLK